MLGRIGFDDKFLYTLVVGVSIFVFGVLVYKSKKYLTELKFIYLWLFVPLIIALVIASKLQVVKVYPLKNISSVQGVLIAKGDDDNSGSSGSGSSGSSRSSSSGSSGSSGSSSSDDDKDDDRDDNSKTSDPSDPSGAAPASSPKSTFNVRVKNESYEDEVKTEIRFGEGEKIKTRVEEGRTRIDVYSGGVKVRYEIRDGRVIIKAETEEGEEVEEQELFKIEDRLDKTGIKVATEGGKLVVLRSSVGAVASFPIQVDLSTNQLIASTSAGPRILTTLPDQAVQNLLTANVISRLDPQVLQQAAKTGGLTSVSDIIALGERNGVAVYEIAGLRDQRLFGFISVTTPIKVVVSAETGQTVTQEQSLLSTIIDFLSS